MTKPAKKPVRARKAKPVAAPLVTLNGWTLVKEQKPPYSTRVLACWLQDVRFTGDQVFYVTIASYEYASYGQYWVSPSGYGDPYAWQSLPAMPPVPLYFADKALRNRVEELTRLERDIERMRDRVRELAIK